MVDQGLRRPSLSIAIQRLGRVSHAIPLSKRISQRKRKNNIEIKMIFAASNALFAASSLLLLAPSPVNAITYNASTHVDCYSSLPSNFIDNGTWTYQSSGYCQEQCVPLGYSVMAMTNGNDCWCGNELPANSTKTDTCTKSCDGWQADACKHLPKPMNI